MKGRDVGVVLVLGVGAYYYASQYYNKTTQIIDSVKVPLIYTNNKIKDTYNYIDTNKDVVIGGTTSFINTFLGLTSINPLNKIRSIFDVSKWLKMI